MRTKIVIVLLAFLFSTSTTNVIADSNAEDVSVISRKERSQHRIPSTLDVIVAHHVFSSSSVGVLKIRAQVANAASLLIPRVSITNSLYFKRNIINVDGYKVYEYTPRLNSNTKDLLMYAHGGGFVMQLQSRQVDMVLDIARYTGQKVVIPVYPLAIEANGNATNVIKFMNNVYDIYQDNYEITLIGDSAGGSIILSQVASREQNNKTLPKNVIALFPAVDNSYANPKMAQIDPKDPLLDRTGLRIAADLYSGSLRINDPLVSPMYAKYSNNYNLMIVNAEIDVLSPDNEAFSNRLTENGITHTYVYYPNAYHDFILFNTNETAGLKRKIVQYIVSN